MRYICSFNIYCKSTYFHHNFLRLPSISCITRVSTLIFDLLCAEKYNNLKWRNDRNIHDLWAWYLHKLYPLDYVFYDCKIVSQFTYAFLFLIRNHIHFATAKDSLIRVRICIELRVFDSNSSRVLWFIVSTFFYFFWN